MANYFWYLRGDPERNVLDEMWLPDHRVPSPRREQIRKEFYRMIGELGFTEDQIKKVPVVKLRETLAAICKKWPGVSKEEIRLELQKEYALIGAIIRSDGSMKFDW